MKKPLIEKHRGMLNPQAGEILRWADPLKAGGRHVLIEARWGTGAGLTAQQIVQSLAPEVNHVSVQKLSLQPEEEFSSARKRTCASQAAARE